MHSHMLKQSTIESQEVPTQDVLALDITTAVANPGIFQSVKQLRNVSFF